ncbi:MAG: transposase, partial [Candidatus Gastranaerophilales bacterium]|nr:transposase [Candidatus Gastranaerophilales bacterium]
MSNYRRAYEKNSYVFITITTFKRNPILIKNIKILRNSIRKTKEKFEFEIFGIVVLPDHIHTILRPKIIRNYPDIIKSIKTDFSKNIDKKEITNVEKYVTESKKKKGEKGVWQRRYWEHTIKDENDLYLHLDYIHFNPVKHNYVTKVNDWLYSSFHKFVKEKLYDENWGTM